MPVFSIYVTEPGAIDMRLVKEALGRTPHTLVAGNTDFTVGNPEACDTLLIRSATRVSANIRQTMPRLKHIVRVGTGLDNVDLGFCEQSGIAVYNAPGANANAVAEYALAVILHALRRLHLLERGDLETWNRFKFMGRGVGSCTVGIVGFGHIGRRLHQKLTALGCEDFLIYDPFIVVEPDNGRLVPLDDLIRQSDIISLHLPLIPQTKHIIDAGKLDLLKRDAILLNSSRGGIVDEGAVLAAMQEKPFIYIADTVEGEPHIAPALLDQPNVIITPHIGSLTHDAEVAMVHTAVKNLVMGNKASRLPA